MTRKEVAEKYLAGSGIRIVNGDCFEFVIPFIVLDIVYDLYGKYIRPLDVKFKLNQIKKLWKKSYDTINKDFFAHFSPDEIDWVIDFMDDFTTYLHNDITILRIQMLTQMNGIDDNGKDVVVAASLAGMLSDAALTYLVETYKRTIKKIVDFPVLRDLSRYSYLFASEYYRMHGNGNVSFNTDQITLAVQAVCNKIAKYGSSSG